MSETKIRVATEVEITLTVEKIAEAFWDLDDDEQARVFVEVARLARESAGGGLNQAYAIGRHLLDCECSTSDARGFVQMIAMGMEHVTP